MTNQTKPINVLSLFDGISCGQIALNRAGIAYNKYFASEIDQHAIKVTQANYPNTIQLGDVTKVTGDSLPQIDLLIGGSPCQGFSFAGKQLNFDDPRSKLFFEFVRLLKECKPKWFLLENVVMKQEYQDVISERLGVKPVEIDSGHFCAQRRGRLYWTNIEILHSPKESQTVIRDIMENAVPPELFVDPLKTVNRLPTKNYIQYDINGLGNKSQSQRAYFLDRKHGTLDTTAPSNAKVVLDDGRIRRITQTEGERLQTVPDGYTNSVDRSKALKALGNGWTVDVIVHIFNSLKPELT